MSCWEVVAEASRAECICASLEESGKWNNFELVYKYIIDIAREIYNLAMSLYTCKEGKSRKLCN